MRILICLFIAGSVCLGILFGAACGKDKDDSDDDDESLGILDDTMGSPLDDDADDDGADDDIDDDDDDSEVWEVADWDLMASGTTVNLFSVWGTASDDVFAVGSGGTILHYDGDLWTAMASGILTEIYDVWRLVR